MSAHTEDDAVVLGLLQDEGPLSAEAIAEALGWFTADGGEGWDSDRVHEALEHQRVSRFEAGRWTRPADPHGSACDAHWPVPRYDCGRCEV